MEIQEIIKSIKRELEKATTILEVDECKQIDSDRIYVSFIDAIDAHDAVFADDFSMEEYAFQQAEAYLQFILENLSVNAEVSLDCELQNDNELWVFGDIVLN